MVEGFVSVVQAACGRPFFVAMDHYFLPPISRPNLGAVLVPVILTGISAPAPFLWKKGSTGLSMSDFHQVEVICESLASVRTFPAKSNFLPSSVYWPARLMVAPGSL